MKYKNVIITLFIVTFLSYYANAQDNPNFKLVGSCEGCEAIFEYGSKVLNAIDTLPGFHDNGTKLKVTGTIFMPDGKTPAKDVILYVYHTDPNGIYTKKGDEKGWARRHGYIRGWVKTGSDGKYTFYTLKPGTYPSRSEPAHIHPTILEPSGKYYWLSSYYFADDPLLNEKHKNEKSPRGGSGAVMSLQKESELWVGKRDFILGKNVPGYE